MRTESDSAGPAEDHSVLGCGVVVHAVCHLRALLEALDKGLCPVCGEEHPSTNIITMRNGADWRRRSSDDDVAMTESPESATTTVTATATATATGTEARARTRPRPETETTVIEVSHSPAAAPAYAEFARKNNDNEVYLAIQVGTQKLQELVLVGDDILRGDDLRFFGTFGAAVNQMILKPHAKNNHRNFCDQLLFDLDGLWEDSIERIESDCMERFIYALATGDATGADAHGPKMRSLVLASSSAHAILERSAYRQAESNTRRCLSR